MNYFHYTFCPPANSTVYIFRNFLHSVCNENDRNYIRCLIMKICGHLAALDNFEDFGRIAARV